MSTTILTSMLAAVQGDANLPFQSVTLTASGGSPSVEVSALVRFDSSADDDTGKKELVRVSLTGMSNAAISAGLSRRLRVYDTVTIDAVDYTITSVRTGHVATDADAESGNVLERTGRSVRL